MYTLPEIKKKLINLSLDQILIENAPYTDLCMGRNWLPTFSLQWNPVNLATNGSQKSGPINRLPVIKGFFKREKDLAFFLG